VGYGGAEHGHDGVAGELLDGAAVALELGAEADVERGQERADVLRVELLGPSREADEVAEERRYDLALLARGGGLGRRGLGLGGRRQLGVLVEDLPLEPLQLRARIDPELFDQQLARLLVER